MLLRKTATFPFQLMLLQRPLLPETFLSREYFFALSSKCDISERSCVNLVVVVAVTVASEAAAEVLEAVVAMEGVVVVAAAVVMVVSWW